MICFIINKIAVRKYLKKLLLEIETIMKEQKILYEIFYTNYPDHATELAAMASSKGYVKIIAVGGDGTIFETVSGLCNSNSIFGVIPLGSGNDFIKTIGMKNFSIKQALDVVINGDVIKSDLISINNRYFVNISSIGIDAEIARTSQKIKNRFKGFSYLFSTIQNIITYKPLKAILKIDNRIIEDTFILIAICNGKYYGGGFMITPIAEINDGLISVCAIKKMPNIKMLLVFPSVIFGKHSFIKQVNFYKGKQIEIILTDENFLNIDGNIYSPLKVLKYTLEEKALNLLIPKN